MSVIEQSGIDLSLLMDNFTVCKGYDVTKEEILKELQDAQMGEDFLVLTSIANDIIDGFIIGYRSRDSFWISQIYRKVGTDLSTSMEAIEMACKWAKERGMTSLIGEVSRNEMRALKRYGFEQKSIIIEKRI